MSAFILTTSGREFHLTDPRPEQVDIHDIATALSRLARFNGHGARFYSVAQHSVVVSLAVPEELALPALLHDAAEAYIGDIVTPVKQLFPLLRGIEDHIQAVIHRALDVPHVDHPAIKRADLAVMSAERRDLGLSEVGTPWPCLAGIDPLRQRIVPVDAEAARKLFLRRFAELRQTCEA